MVGRKPLGFSRITERELTHIESLYGRTVADAYAHESRFYGDVSFELWKDIKSKMIAAAASSSSSSIASKLRPISTMSQRRTVVAVGSQQRPRLIPIGTTAASTSKSALTGGMPPLVQKRITTISTAAASLRGKTPNVIVALPCQSSITATTAIDRKIATLPPLGQKISSLTAAPVPELIPIRDLYASSTTAAKKIVNSEMPRLVPIEAGYYHHHHHGKKEEEKEKEIMSTTTVVNSELPKLIPIGRGYGSGSDSSSSEGSMTSDSEEEEVGDTMIGKHYHGHGSGGSSSSSSSLSSNSSDSPTSSDSEGGGGIAADLGDEEFGSISISDHYPGHRSHHRLSHSKSSSEEELSGDEMIQSSPFIEGKHHHGGGKKKKKDHHHMVSQTTPYYPAAEESKIGDEIVNYIGTQDELKGYIAQQAKTTKALEMLSAYIASAKTKINARDAYSFIALDDAALKRNALVDQILGEKINATQFVERHTFRNASRAVKGESITMENLLGERVVVGTVSSGIALPHANDCTISSVVFNVYVSAIM